MLLEKTENKNAEIEFDAKESFTHSPTHIHVNFSRGVFW